MKVSALGEADENKLVEEENSRAVTVEGEKTLVVEEVSKQPVEEEEETRKHMVAEVAANYHTGHLRRRRPQRGKRKWQISA